MVAILSGLFVLGILASGAPAIQPAPVTVPLTAIVRQPDNTGTFAIELTNTGEKLAVAWSVRIAIRSADPRGNITHLDTDLYPLLIIPTEVPLKPIPPNRSTVLTTLPPDTPAPIVVTPLAVVYDDGTAVGDEARIQLIFKRRVEEAKAWKELAGTLRQASAGPVNRATITALRDNLDSVPTQDRGESKRRLVVSHLERILQTTAPDQTALMNLVAITEKYATGAAVQAVRH